MTLLYDSEYESCATVKALGLVGWREKCRERGTIDSDTMVGNLLRYQNRGLASVDTEPGSAGRGPVTVTAGMAGIASVT